MRKQSTRKFRPSLLHLEDRKLMAVRVMPVGEDTGGLSLSPVVVSPPATPPFDNDLTVTLSVDHRVSPAVASIDVDGSDFEDHIQVLDYRQGQSVTVQLEKWSNGVQLSNNIQTLFLAGVSLRANTPLTILGRGGNDQIRNMTAIPAHIEGGTGNDFISVGLSSGQADGQEGDDTIIGSGYADQLSGGEGNDYIRGGDGGDTIFGGGGNNVIYGEGGDDLINPGSLPESYGGMIDGGDGNDYINAGGWDVNVFGGNDNDTIYSWGGVGVNSGGAGNDTFYGSGDLDIINGDGGNDVVYGGYGDDQIAGGDGDDVIHGDGGNDQISGGAGQDNIHGDNGNDVLQGNDDNDRLYGDSGVDSLYGGDREHYLRRGLLACHH